MSLPIGNLCGIQICQASSILQIDLWMLPATKYFLHIAAVTKGTVLTLHHLTWWNVAERTWALKLEDLGLNPNLSALFFFKIWPLSLSLLSSYTSSPQNVAEDKP